MWILPRACLEGWAGRSIVLCVADDGTIPSIEFSGSLIRTVKGPQYHAQVFAKEDRLRL